MSIPVLHGTLSPMDFWTPPRLAHQNRTIASASDFRVDGAKSPEISQKEGVWGSEIAARNRRSLATVHRTLKSQCKVSEIAAISGVRDGHRNRKLQKSLRFRCAKPQRFLNKAHFDACLNFLCLSSCFRPHSSQKALRDSF